MKRGVRVPPKAVASSSISQNRPSSRMNSSWLSGETFRGTMSARTSMTPSLKSSM
jgi:hypothetical protein